MCKVFNRFRRSLRVICYDAGYMSFYGFRSRVFVLFWAHVYVGICRRSHRLMIEFV